MTYIEKMAITIRGGKTIKRAEDLVEQIIADDRAACLESIKPFSRFAHMHYSAYVEAIEGAKIKEQEK